MDKRLDFDTVKPNDPVPQLTKLVDQKRINKWADAVGDYNPLHVDPEYAKKTKFKRTIAHGPLIISYISEMMSNWLGTGWIDGGKLLDIRFKSPVKSGDIIIVGGLVKKKTIVEDKRTFECEVFIENQEGIRIIEGKAIGTVG
jgi:3-hydroxybutyryl-CoA dehydratase